MKDKKHILLISSWYPNPEKPFLGNFVQRQAELLAKEYRVTVINTIVENTVSELKTKIIENNGVTEIQVFYPSSKSLLKKRKVQFSAFELGLSRVKNVDLIIGEIALPKSWQFLQAKKKFRCPLFYIDQGSYYRPEIRNNWNFVEKYLIWQLKRKTDCVIAVSEFLKKDMQEVFKKEQVNVIGNHIDTDLFSLSPETNNGKTHFLHISTLDENTKNPVGMINAIEKLSLLTGEFKFTFVCDENVEKWQDLINKKGLNSYVDFVGPLEWHETVPHYHKADAFVLFSKYETFSVVLAESFSTGTPVISTNVGIADGLPSELGTIVKTEIELCDAMYAMVKNKKSYDSKLIREFGMNFREETILKKWITILSEYVN